jgi:hypothetical protein
MLVEVPPATARRWSKSSALRAGRKWIPFVSIAEVENAAFADCPAESLTRVLSVVVGSADDFQGAFVGQPTEPCLVTPMRARLPSSSAFS